MKSIPSPRLKFQALTLSYGAVLVILAVIPRVEGAGIAVSDWILHGLAYGIFGGLLFGSSLDRNYWWAAGTAVAGAGFFGLATEFLQMLIPYRSFEITDFIADSVGALVVVLALVAGIRIARSLGWGGS